MCHILRFCNDCHFHVYIWNDERIIGQRDRIIGQRSRNNRENNVEIWNRIIGKYLGIIGSGLRRREMSEKGRREKRRREEVEEEAG